MHERRHRKLCLHDQPRLRKRLSPVAPGKEVQETGTEGEEVWPVSAMLHYDQFSPGSQNASNLSKQFHPLRVMAQLVRSKDRESRVEQIGVQGQRVVAC